MWYEFGLPEVITVIARVHVLDRVFQAAADVVCAQLGFEFGSVSTSPCTSYGGSNLCGSPGSQVAMSSLTCGGGELDIQECAFSVPDTTCLGHAHDSIVYCGTGGSADGFQEGAARLLSFDGSRAIMARGSQVTEGLTSACPTPAKQSMF